MNIRKKLGYLRASEMEVPNPKFVAGVYLFANLFDKGIAFLTIPVLTRLMTTADYGIKSTYVSWVGIFTVIVCLSVGNSLRAACVDHKDDIDGYCSSLVLLAYLCGIVSFVLVAVLTLFLPFGIGRELVLLAVIQSIMSSIVAIFTIRYMMEVAYIKKAILQSLPNILVVIISIPLVIILSTDKYLGSVLAYVLVYLGFGLFLTVAALKKKHAFGCNLVSYWRYALAFSLPLVFHGISNMVLSQADRIMIMQINGANDAGIYSLIYSFSMIATVIMSALEQVWIPWFTKKMERSDIAGINKRLPLYITCMAVLMSAIVLVAPEVLILLAPEGYWSGKFMIAPILCGCYLMFLYSISVDFEYYAKATGIIAKCTLVAALLNIVLNLVVIPRYGAIGAAYTTLVTYFVQFLIHYIAGKRINSGLFPIASYVPPTILVGVCCVVQLQFMDICVLRWFCAAVIVIVTILRLVKKKKVKV